MLITNDTFAVYYLQYLLSDCVCVLRSCDRCARPGPTPVQWNTPPWSSRCTWAEPYCSVWACWTTQSCRSYVQVTQHYCPRQSNQYRTNTDYQSCKPMFLLINSLWKCGLLYENMLNLIEGSFKLSSLLNIIEVCPSSPFYQYNDTHLLLWPLSCQSCCSACWEACRATWTAVWWAWGAWAWWWESVWAHGWI